MTTQAIIDLEDRWMLPTYQKMPIALVRGEGTYVWDAEGNRYVDFYGGHCVTPLGHCPPAVVQAIKEQAETLMFYSNVVYNPMRAEAAALLAHLSPPGLQNVYFCNSGAEAIETALKLARKWTGKPGLVAMHGAFHGRTLGALAATWGENFRAPYKAILPETIHVPFGLADVVEDVLRKRQDIAAVILEPIQSMAGVIEAPDQYYQSLRTLCDRHGAALIFDEIQTGVGRTGTFSISEQLGVTPDLITMAKGLGSGVPVGAVLASNAISESVQFGDQGTTFGGGMIAMAAMRATLQTLVDEQLMTRPPILFDQIRSAVRDRIRAIRGRGCLIGLELDGPATPVVRALRKQGILTGGSGDPNVIRLMPPLNTPQEAIDAFVEAFVDERVHV
jgi:acetylornithine/N-succinyldiaminopimelate aminotransferase